MGLETEWRFVVTRLPALPDCEPRQISQGYLNEGVPVIRARLMGERGFLTIKAGMPGGTGKGPSRRMEFEYEIPARDAKALVQMSPLRVEKKRYLLDGGIELDVFEGPHEGLVIAEVEVEDGDAPAPEPPDGWEWIDVSGDLCYSNRALAEHGTPNDAPRAAIGP